MRASGALAPVLLGVLVVLAGCAADEACAPVCPAAGDWYERWLDEWGLTWGPDSGYQDRADWDNGCATIQLEDRLLASTSADPRAERARAQRCRAQQEVIGGDCDDYAALWDSP